MCDVFVVFFLLGGVILEVCDVLRACDLPLNAVELFSHGLHEK